MEEDRKPSPVNETVKEQTNMDDPQTAIRNIGNHSMSPSPFRPVVNVEYTDKTSSNHPITRYQLEDMAESCSYRNTSPILNHSLDWISSPEQGYNNNARMYEQHLAMSNYGSSITSFLSAHNSRRLNNSLHQKLREDELKLIMQNSNTIDYLRRRSLSYSAVAIPFTNTDQLSSNMKNGMNDTGDLLGQDYSKFHSIVTPASQKTMREIGTDDEDTKIILPDSTAVDSTDDVSQLKQLKKPKRPLTAYNFFFKDQRKVILQEGIKSLDTAVPTKGQHTGLVTIVSSRWQQVTPSVKQHYDSLAVLDRKRYDHEMISYTKRKHAAWTAAQQALEKTVPDEALQRYLDEQSQVQVRNNKIHGKQK